MRFLKLCFVLMVLGISARAQEKDTCFYHVSFRHFQWNYCYGLDTLFVPESKSLPAHDTVIYEKRNIPSHFVLERRASTWVTVAWLEVTSMDSSTKYKVKGYDIIANPGSPNMKKVASDGANTGVKGIGLLYETENGEHLQLNNIRILDPVSKKEIVLPGIDIYVD